MPRKPVLRANVYEVLRRAVEEGVRYGLRRAYKHEAASMSDAEQARVAEHVEREIMNAAAEVLRLGDE